MNDENKMINIRSKKTQPTRGCLPLLPPEMGGGDLRKNREELVDNNNMININKLIQTMHLS